MGRIRTKVFVLALIAVMVTIISTSTVSYYQTTGKATNVVTSGNIKFIIHETTDNGTEFPVNGVFVSPGDIVSKKVTVENICEHPFYLRVKPIYGVDSNELTVEDCFKLNINSESWILHDGWYYYKNVVNPNDTTDEIFSRVEIVGAKVDNRYIGKTLQLTVKAQAVQSENNPITDGNVYTASGWPKEAEG